MGFCTPPVGNLSYPVKEHCPRLIFHEKLNKEILKWLSRILKKWQLL